MRFRTYIIGDDKTTFIGYDDTEIDVTNVVIIDAYGSNNVDEMDHITAMPFDIYAVKMGLCI